MSAADDGCQVVELCPILFQLSPCPYFECLKSLKCGYGEEWKEWVGFSKTAVYSLQYSNVKYTVVIYLLNGFPFFLFNFFLFILSPAVD